MPSRRIEEEIKNVNLKTPYNPTDPEVVFDPEMEFSTIVLPYTTEGDDERTWNANNLDQMPLKYDAIRVPLIKLNNKIIDSDNIESFDLKLENFLPELDLIINDIDSNIQASDIPKMNNVITVILTAPINGAAKKISLDFYITSCNFNIDGTIEYKAEFKLQTLKQVMYTQIGDTELSTYELLETIAKENKLGFAATNKCKEINDKRWRQIYSQTYIEYIDNELSYGGLDKDSIFDAWIDEFGYLVLVNVPYIMNENVDPKQLVTKSITGLTTTTEYIQNENQVIELQRMITNDKYYGDTIINLRFNLYNSIVDNSKILKTGTSNRYYYIDSPCDGNFITTKSIEVVENSVDGVVGKDDYKYITWQYIGANQEEGIYKIMQKELRVNYFNQIYSNLLEVILTDANYALERGMLLQVIIFEYSATNKQMIINNYPNSIQEEEVEMEEVGEVPEGSTDVVMNRDSGVVNPSLSGLYYIKGMHFTYTNNSSSVQQKLILVKKGIINNMINKYAPTKYFNN